MRYLPNPLDRPPVNVTVGRKKKSELALLPDNDGPLCALAFKVGTLLEMERAKWTCRQARIKLTPIFLLRYQVIFDKHRGPLVFVRVYSGRTLHKRHSHSCHPESVQSGSHVVSTIFKFG